MNTTYKVLIGVVIGLLVATGVGYLIAHDTITSSSLGGVVGVGQVQTNTFWFVNGLFAGTSQQWSVSSAGLMTTTGGLTLGSSGTKVSTYSCSTATWNPPSVATTSQQTLDVSTPGVTLGDVEQASLATSTQGLSIEANASTTATSTVILSNNSAAAVDIATTTVKVCYTH